MNSITLYLLFISSIESIQKLLLSLSNKSIKTPLSFLTKDIIAKFGSILKSLYISIPLNKYPLFLMDTTPLDCEKKLLEVK
jgi:hypothetical protein